MPEHRILIVEDDEGIREGLRDALEGEEYVVLTATDGRAGLDRGLCEDPDLILLDLMLPKMDGFEVLARLRQDHVATPVIVLTARGLEEDRVRGLDLGADDYVVKPFALSELLARIRSRLRTWDRERGHDEAHALRFGDVVVDFEAMTARRGEQDLALTPQELQLLRYLVERAGKAVTRNELLERVWGDEDVTHRVVDTAVLGLRKKIEPDPAHPRHVISIRGVGYRFDR